VVSKDTVASAGYIQGHMSAEKSRKAIKVFRILISDGPMGPVQTYIQGTLKNDLRGRICLACSVWTRYDMYTLFLLQIFHITIQSKQHTKSLLIHI